MTPVLVAVVFCLVVPALLFLAGYYVGRHGSPVRVEFGSPARAATALDDLDDDDV
jgi:hypothetical protein